MAADQRSPSATGEINNSTSRQFSVSVRETVQSPRRVRPIRNIRITVMSHVYLMDSPNYVWSEEEPPLEPAEEPKTTFRHWC